jgi:hypothetical protein
MALHNNLQSTGFFESSYYKIIPVPKQGTSSASMSETPLALFSETLARITACFLKGFKEALF